MRRLELLAPARNLECGMAAIDHGADAVYIGAGRFGARAAAGNTLDDIAALCRYAHVYRSRVYVTVNTIIFDQELAETRNLLEQLQRIGVDAVLVQDMGLLAGNAGGETFSHLPFHASTQTDNRSAEKVKWLRKIGFRRVVLARELSAEEIAAIHREVPDVELEVFVHGALCVSYSGVCYASQFCFGRSANRGACAQFCRMAFDLKDANGRTLVRQRHLLSLKDLCLADHLEELAEAGAVSFKIEGRLKDVAYVKNVVAAYSQSLNEVIAKSGGKYGRTSLGRVSYSFTPQLEKTFNRGFTTYFLHGRQPDIFSPDTPKAMGEYVGKVKELRGQSFNVAGTASFANGDGLCFVNGNGELEGFRVNRAEGNKLFPQRMPQQLRPGTPLYRNQDVAFERMLAGKSASRSIPIRLLYTATADGFRLRGWLEELPEVHAEVSADMEKQWAKTPQHENILRQLTKLGQTPYVCESVEVDGGADNYFVPSSMLADLRRQLVERLTALVCSHVEEQRTSDGQQAADDEQRVAPWHPAYQRYPYLYNISNRQAREFYAGKGLHAEADAFELQVPKGLRQNAVDEPLLLMQCRHCLRFSLGHCVKRGGSKPSWHEPLYLELADKRHFRLEFDCKECQMNVYNQ